MKEDVRKYAELSETLEDRKEKLRKSQEEFNRENANLIEEIDYLKARVSEKKSEVQTQALERFQETGEKKLFGGIAIRENTAIDYDPNKVLEWAKNKGMFLQLDKKAFEKAAPSLGSDLKGIVEIYKEPKVTFPKKVILEESE